MVRTGHRTQTATTSRGDPTRAATVLAIFAAAGWVWAVTLLSAREHLAGLYCVLAAAPPLWGMFTLGNAGLLAACVAGTLWVAGCRRVARTSGRAFPSCTRWLLVAWMVPVADGLRLAGWEIPYSFFEPILIAGVTGAAAQEIARRIELRTAAGRSDLASQSSRPGSKEDNSAHANVRLESLTYGLARGGTKWLAAVWVLAVACGGWWYHQAQQAYDNYLLGYNDFGQFAWRVANTWEGRGFLMETPSWPAFWDHFNPGLALLAPLWGLWPDARLFFVIQAFCLALPAPLVYAIARQLGARPSGAAAWAAAYLAFPAVGLLNLNSGYGWHPISLALPLLLAAMGSMLRGWRGAALAAAVLACSFQEDVLVVLACLSLLMAFQAFRDRARDPAVRPPISALADRLPWRGWLAACAMLLAGFVVIFEFSGLSRFQVGRFAHLGNSPAEVLLSPVLRPQAFWGSVFQWRSAYFLLALLVPLGLGRLRRGWIVLSATFLPLGVLLAWGHVPATSIAFQYTTALVPVFFLAGIAGAAMAAACPSDSAAVTAGRRAGALWVGGIAATVAGASASAWFGAMPWSSPTLNDMIWKTYGAPGQKSVLEDRIAGSPGNAMLNQIVARVGGRESSVLATGRIAAHLLGVRRLDTLAQARDRWKDFEAEIGPGRSAIELFDWIVIDTAENLYQSDQERAFIMAKARQAGYALIWQGHDIEVYARPALVGETRP